MCPKEGVFLLLLAVKERKKSTNETQKALGPMYTCIKISNLTCDLMPALARQRKRMSCPGTSHANAGTESQVKPQVDTYL
jgi:hypothetical protein